MSERRRWVVYTHGGGRMGNQLLRWAHWLAWAMDYPDQAGVVNLAFWPYARFFEGSVGQPGCVFPGRSAALDFLASVSGRLPDWFLARAEWRAQHAVHALGACVPGLARIGRRRDHREAICLEGHDFFERLSGHRVTTCAGWAIAGWGRVRRRRDELRAFFRPAGEVGRRSREFVAAQRARFGKVVGVLIRQGDYMQWQGGRFGYPSSEYVEWLRELLALEGGRVGFLIASDTWQDPALFEGLPHVFSGGSANAGGPAIASFAELAECDLVLSPPSTFSASAAFVGGRPFWPLCVRGQGLDKTQILADGWLDAANHPVCATVVK
jgi:hypothetical protein